MILDLQLLGSKLSRYRSQFQASIPEVSSGTGISADLLQAYEKGEREPSGDHILILADYFKCDYKFFLSNEKLAAFEQTETLFRLHGDEISKEDRWAIQEFLFLCECEEYVLGITPTLQRSAFVFHKTGSFFKQHGADAAAALRQHLGYRANAVSIDVFDDFRRIGLHVFRRTLENSDISGLFIRHPTAGRCILINYSEDVYRQRFTAAHEAGHAILDDNADVVVSFTKWDKKDLSEVRANAFASRYLMPPEFLKAIPDASQWTSQKALEWARKLKVSTTALSMALLDQGSVDEETANQIRSVRVPRDDKADVELPSSLALASHARKNEMLRRGLSDFYVRVCLDAYEDGHISAGRLAEMLLVPADELHSLASLYGRRLSYGD